MRERCECANVPALAVSPLPTIQIDNDAHHLCRTRLARSMRRLRPAHSSRMSNGGSLDWDPNAPLQVGENQPRAARSALVSVPVHRRPTTVDRSHFLPHPYPPRQNPNHRAAPDMNVQLDARHHEPEYGLLRVRGSLED